MTVAPRDAEHGLPVDADATYTPIEVMHVITSPDFGGAETMLARLIPGDTAEPATGKRPRYGIAEVAAAAPPGAVTVAPWGDAFRSAMEEAVLSPLIRMRPSLLPEHYERDRVLERFKALVGLP